MKVRIVGELGANIFLSDPCYVETRVFEQVVTEVFGVVRVEIPEPSSNGNTVWITRHEFRDFSADENRQKGDRLDEVSDGCGCHIGLVMLWVGHVHIGTVTSNELSYKVTVVESCTPTEVFRELQ